MNGKPHLGRAEQSCREPREDEGGEVEEHLEKYSQKLQSEEFWDIRMNLMFPVLDASSFDSQITNGFDSFTQQTDTAMTQTIESA